MRRSYKLAVVLLAVMISAAFTPHTAAAKSQPMMSIAPSYEDQAAGPVFEQLAATIEIQIGPGKLQINSGEKNSGGKTKKKKLKKKAGSCPPGQNRDPNSGVCFSCSHNDHFDPAKGRCVPCKAGFHVEGDRCVPNKKNSKSKKSCPEGTEFRSGKCRPPKAPKKSEFPEIEDGPEGQNSGQNTGGGFSCSHNDHFDPAKGRCVPCKPGFHEADVTDDNGEVNRECVPD
ncbi:MAG: hypothetical protein LCH46_08560 [Proteobacteria bacterium]|nr:hypothetical protein [Pseudomonadota bacterium]